MSSAGRSKKSSSQPRIYAARLGPKGAVIRIAGELTVEMAAAERQLGHDIVVCGSVLSENRAVARLIESMVGRYVRQDPHASAGPEALPHFQPFARPPAGHTFYESDRRKAK